MTVESKPFYLKVNTYSDFALKRFMHWVDIANACGATIYVVCDNLYFEERIKTEVNQEFLFIPSNPAAKDLLSEILNPNWLNVGIALLTPFIHAKENGIVSFWNIDADDTIMLNEAKVIAEALTKASEYADVKDINCFSLDFASTPMNRIIKHWSFGVTYIKLNADYISLIEQYPKLLPDLVNEGMAERGMLDEIFKNLDYKGLLRNGVFYINNLYFRHNNINSNFWNDSRFYIKDVCERVYYKWKLTEKDLQDGIPIGANVVKIEQGITEQDCLNFIERSGLSYKLKQDGVSNKRKISFREELAKTFSLFRANINTRIFLFGGYNYFNHAANEYSIITGLDLFNEISGYVDNDPSKHGTSYNGFPIISPLDLQKDDFIIITGSPVHIEMYRQLCGLGFIHRLNFILAWDFEMIIKRYAIAKTRNLKGTREGERCFIMGNGPSLNLDDLKILHSHNEYTFVSNNFCKLYDKTDFRPSYYVIIDVLNLDNYKRIPNSDGTTYFISFDSKNYAMALDDVYFFEKSMWLNYDYYPYNPLFSDDIALAYDCGSVSYAMLQLAFNMGFKEIYLLGMDNEFPLLITHDGTLVHKKDAAHHFYNNTNPTQVCYTKDLFEAGYAYGEEFCRDRGVNIYNATRGGKLEVFERVDFESLFPSEGKV